ncbi:MAG: hypothetical protein MJ252_28280 [archaeon]|nr:hypothetical protein [archaeon]
MEEEFPTIEDQEILSDFETNGNVMMVFANPKSGSKEGVSVLNLAQQFNKYKTERFKILHFPLDQTPNKTTYTDGGAPEESDASQNTLAQKLTYSPYEAKFTVLIFNLIEREEFKVGINFAKAYLEKYPNNTLKILIAGGDGTVLSIVKEMNKNKINLERLVFGPMPFGTGNDLSNALGFGNTIKIAGNIKTLNRILFTYLNAKPTKIDIWDFEVDLKPTGRMIKISNSKETPMLIKDTNDPITNFKESFINYCSIGYDAKVGFNFDQKRSSSQCWNKCIYCCEGCKRLWCCGTNVKMSTIIDKFYSESDEKNKKEKLIEEKPIALLPVSDSEKEEENKKEELLENIPEVPQANPNEGQSYDKINNQQPTTIFDFSDKNEKITLKGDSVNIICQNINFYMGGTRDIWEKAGTSLATTITDGKKEEINDYKRKVLESFSKQRYDDKRIEFFSYEHAISLGLENIKTGHADKLYQGEGPFVMKFKDSTNEKEKSLLNQIYVNCDGEFFHLFEPNYLKISLTQEIQGGQINILTNATPV